MVIHKPGVNYLIRKKISYSEFYIDSSVSCLQLCLPFCVYIAFPNFFWDAHYIFHSTFDDNVLCSLFYVFICLLLVLSMTDYMHPLLGLPVLNHQKNIKFVFFNLCFYISFTTYKTEKSYICCFQIDNFRIS